MQFVKDQKKAALKMIDESDDTCVKAWNLFKRGILWLINTFLWNFISRKAQVASLLN